MSYAFPILYITIYCFILVNIFFCPIFNNFFPLSDFFHLPSRITNSASLIGMRHNNYRALESQTIRPHAVQSWHPWDAQSRRQDGNDRLSIFPRMIPGTDREAWLRVWAADADPEQTSWSRSIPHMDLQGSGVIPYNRCVRVRHRARRKRSRQQTRDVCPVSVQCWAGVADAGPRGQHWLDLGPALVAWRDPLKAVLGSDFYFFSITADLCDYKCTQRDVGPVLDHWIGCWPNVQKTSSNRSGPCNSTPYFYISGTTPPFNFLKSDSLLPGEGEGHTVVPVSLISRTLKNVQLILRNYVRSSILPCKAKRQYLLTLQVSRYCLWAFIEWLVYALCSAAPPTRDQWGQGSNPRFLDRDRIWTAWSLNLTRSLLPCMYRGPV